MVPYPGAICCLDFHGLSRSTVNAAAGMLTALLDPNRDKHTGIEKLLEDVEHPTETRWRASWFESMKSGKRD